MGLSHTKAVLLLTSGLPLLFVLIVAAALVHGSAWAASAEPKPAGSNERLQKLMTRRYEVLTQAVQRSRPLMEAGRVELAAWRDLNVAMYRAQADLAATAVERVKVHERLVEFLVLQEKFAEQRADAGRITRMQLDEGKVATLNARIDIERLRLASAPAQSP
jgi:hypothetical protein